MHCCLHGHGHGVDRCRGVILMWFLFCLYVPVDIYVDVCRFCVSCVDPAIRGLTGAGRIAFQSHHQMGLYMEN